MRPGDVIRTDTLGSPNGDVRTPSPSLQHQREQDRMITSRSRIDRGLLPVVDEVAVARRQGRSIVTCAGRLR